MRSRIEDIEKSIEIIRKALSDLADSSTRHNLDEIQSDASPSRLREPLERSQSPPRVKRKLNGSGGAAGIDSRAANEYYSDSDDEGAVALNPLTLLATSAGTAEERDNARPDRPSSPPTVPLPPRWRLTPYQMLDSRAYWRKSHFQPVPDSPDQSPSVIDAGFITEAQADRYLKVFFEGHNRKLRLLDPHLHTLGYVRQHSSLLLGVICALEARYTEGDESVALAIRKWIHENALQAAITPPSFKSFELAQAWVIMVAYGSTAEVAQHDRSWSFLFLAIRVATELGLHIAPASASMTSGKSEAEIRRMRNQERLWLVLWHLERTVCAQTGRPSLMPKQPFENANMSDWHTRLYALPEDAITIGNIELEMTASHHQQLYRNLLSDGTQDHSVRLQFYRDAVSSELSKWRTRYALRPTPEQIQALSSASMALCSLPLRDRRKETASNFSALQHRELKNECRLSAMEFIESCAAQPVQHLVLATSQYIMSAVHAAILLVQFANRPQSPLLPESSASQRAMERVQVFSSKLLESSRIPMSRSWNSVAATYAQLMQRILSRTNDVAVANKARAAPDGNTGRYLPSPKMSPHFAMMMAKQNPSRPLSGLRTDPSGPLPPANIAYQSNNSHGDLPSLASLDPTAGSMPLVRPQWQDPVVPLFAAAPPPSALNAQSQALGWPLGRGTESPNGPMDSNPLLFDNLMDQLLGLPMQQEADSEQMRKLCMSFGNERTF